MAANLQGGRLEAFKQGQVLSETGIYMPDGRNIEEDVGLQVN